MKMGRAGLHGRGPHRETSVIGQDLHVAAEGLVLTGVPQVVAGLGADCDPVGAHQSAVQAHKKFASAPEPVQDVSDVVGSPLSDDLQGLVQVPVGSGLRDPAIAGQGPHIGAVLEPPQHQNGLDPGGGGPLAGSGVVGASVCGQPAADGTHSSDGDVESGTIGHPRGAFLASRFSWSKTTLTHGSACTPIRHTPPQPYPPFSAIPVLRPPVPPPPVRKPH